MQHTRIYRSPEFKAFKTNKLPGTQYLIRGETTHELVSAPVIIKYRKQAVIRVLPDA